MSTEQASEKSLATRETRVDRVGHKLTTTQMEVADVIGQVAVIREIMDTVMQEGMHYGKVPGTDKPTLFLPGAQKLGMTFRFRVSYPKVERTDFPNNSGEAGEERPAHREYQVEARIEDGAGNFMGEGLGLCSTLESKYRFRTQEQFEATEHQVPQSYWKLKDKRDKVRTLAQIMDDVSSNYGTKKIDGVWRIVRFIGEGAEKVEYPNPADYYNTVLKMAKKRAFVDAILTVTAAGDLFTQDLEDIDANKTALSEETGKQWDGEETSKAGTEKTGGTEAREKAKDKATDKKPEGAHKAPDNWRENYIHFPSTLKDRKLGSLILDELTLVRDKWINDEKFWKKPSAQDLALKAHVLQGIAELTAGAPANDTSAPAGGGDWDAVKYATQISDALAEQGIHETRYFEILRYNRQIPEGADWHKLDDVDDGEWLKHQAITLPHLLKLDEARRRTESATGVVTGAVTTGDLTGLGDQQKDTPPATDPAPAQPPPETKKRAPRKKADAKKGEK